jgi:hypothetical protein
MGEKKKSIRDRWVDLDVGGTRYRVEWDSTGELGHLNFRQEMEDVAGRLFWSDSVNLIGATESQRTVLRALADMALARRISEEA